MKLYVDVEALTELARQLTEIRSSLEQVSDALDPVGLGTGKLLGALEDFVGGWRDGRQRIIEAIEGLLGRIQGAVNTYLEQERVLSEAAGARR
ncbi:MAG: hypothetical protein ACT4OM_07560 [Actinomycetota bacterium]